MRPIALRFAVSDAWPNHRSATRRALAHPAFGDGHQSGRAGNLAIIRDSACCIVDPEATQFALGTFEVRENWCSS
jgi:hypothetical protein